MMDEWDIRPEGRAWAEDEAFGRFQRTPEKIEMMDGKLFLDEEERLVMLALLLENVGANDAVKLGDPAVWKAAIARLG